MIKPPTRPLQRFVYNKVTGQKTTKRGYVNMAILKKKTVEVTPTIKVNEACILVEQQQSQFTTMIQEVEKAMALRAEAIEETQKEINSLEAQLNSKNTLIENATLQNNADQLFINKLKEMIGKI